MAQSNNDRGNADQKRLHLLEQDYGIQQELVTCIKQFLVPKMYGLVKNGQ